MNELIEQLKYAELRYNEATMEDDVYSAAYEVLAVKHKIAAYVKQQKENRHNDNGTRLRDLRIQPTVSVGRLQKVLRMLGIFKKCA